MPVEGHVGGLKVLILKPLSLYLELDVAAGIVTVLDARKRDVDVSKDKDRLRRRGSLLFPKEFDHHLGILAWISAGDSYSGNVGEIRHGSLRDWSHKLITIG
ncbi:MAG: hypothetical protein QF638_02550 [Acidimicrobiales bacterium]|nr:hypothetical protein [Acidimicrobiales bacterium]